MLAFALCLVSGSFTTVEQDNAVGPTERLVAGLGRYVPCAVYEEDFDKLRRQQRVSLDQFYKKPSHLLARCLNQGLLKMATKYVS